MANFHSDKWIMEKIQEHYEEAKTLIPEDRIIGIFLQGSQNYGLDIEGSDIDTKLIVAPTLNDIIFNKSPISTTHIRANEEHIDLKDVRLYMQCFRKQNLNFLEILFTPYKIINPLYEQDWNILIQNNEKIAHYNVVGSVKTMEGIAMEKYHALEHRYPSKVEIIDKYGYDGKQLHHLIRVYEYLKRYIAGESYQDCLISLMPETLKQIKQQGLFTLAEARNIADKYINDIVITAEDYVRQFGFNIPIDKEVDKILDLVQSNIMIKAIRRELE